MVPCSRCYEDVKKVNADGLCAGCEDRVAREKAFATFANGCGLSRFPHVYGERYVYNVDFTLAGKKSECTDFIDELWNALVRAKSGDKTLLIN